MKENNINHKNNISIFLSTEVNELYSKSYIKESYITPEKEINLKIIFFTFKNTILKNFKITIGKEKIISNEFNSNKKKEKIDNNNYSIEYDNNNDYYFTINLGIVEKNTSIEINAIYLSYMQHEESKYISNLFKRYPILYLKDENNDFNIINIDKLEGEITLKAHNKIESFNLNMINFNEDIINKESSESNNIMNGKITLNTLNKQYISTKQLYLKYQLKGIENIKEYKIYQFLIDFIPIIRLTFIISSLPLSIKRSSFNPIGDKTPKIILFNQKVNKNDNKSMNILLYKYLFNKNDINEKTIYPNKYLFVVDESLYMEGEKIGKIRGALKLLLFSLNSNCEYQIIGFNETIKMYDSNFKHAIKSNIIKTLEYISNIYIENKKCNIYSIIKLIYYLCNKNKNIPINIFLFTNAICDKVEINKALNIIYENSLEKNFHLNIISLGEKYNKYFVISGSILGNGNYYLINNLNQLNKEVINELSNCYKEYYSNINCDISKSISIKKYKSNISQINCFDNNPLNLYFISKNIEPEENIKMKIYYKKYLKGKFLLQNTIFNNIEINNLDFGQELYILYLYKIFYENNNNNNLNNNIKNFFGFSKFLKEQSEKYEINFDNIYDIFYYEKDNIKIPLKNNFYNNNFINEDNSIDFCIEQNNENKDYFDIFPLTEKKYHDFLLVDEIQDYSESKEIQTPDKNKKIPRKKSYGKMMIGGIFKGVGKVGNSLAFLGKNIGQSISNKKVTNFKDDKNDNKREIKSQNIPIKLTPGNDEDDLENNEVDNYLGNKYGYTKKDEFIMNAVFSQDLEGFWDINNKKLNKIKEKYKEMSNVVENYLKGNIPKNEINEKNIDLQRIINNVKMTFIIIVDIFKNFKDKEEEFYFIIEKGKNYIKKYGYDFNFIEKDIGLIIE